LHNERLKTRWYNQCLEIARGISEITGNKVLEVLKRERATDTQTHLSRWDRFENTSNEFVVTDSKVIRNKRILLLDDIITTGATMAGSASPLIKEGARLSIAAIALTQDT
jgi:predicted amidophosphoribosyltransferase